MTSGSGHEPEHLGLGGDVKRKQLSGCSLTAVLPDTRASACLPWPAGRGGRPDGRSLLRARDGGTPQ
eukprot:2311227-Heterocapsa_arctica.AAC.1